MARTSAPQKEAANGSSRSTTEASADAVASSSASSPVSRDDFSYHSVSLAQTDALPYYDRELDVQPELRSRVDALIAAEQATFPPLDPSSSSRLPPPFVLFSSRPDLQNELQRVAEGLPASPKLDMTRYTLPEPDESASASVEDWQRAVDNAHSQLGHMEVRLKNIELLKKYGPNSWRLSNFQQEQDIRSYTDLVEKVKDETNEINRLRQKDQTEAGNKLSILEKKWTELISRGLQIEVANITTEEHVEALRRKKRKLEDEIERLDSLQ